MNSVTLLLIASALFLLGYFVYGRHICKLVGIDPQRKCPSETKQDNIDYVPTSPYIIYGHHFSSIAGAGPIVGPVLACLFGWGPAVLWIILGCIFCGSIHDFSAMFLSVRNEGRSIAYIIENELGYFGRQLFLAFCLFAIMLILANFSILVIDTFISTPSVATTSILFILMAPVFGIVTRYKLLGLLEAALIFVPLLFLCVWVGILFPVNWVGLFGSVANARIACIALIIYYVFVASILPVWFLLQPRDYLNSYLLSTMLALAFIGVLVSQPDLNMPFYINPAEVYGANKFTVVPDLIPFLFITIACGACSGFHSLVASGTSSKQVSNETHIRPISMGGMYVEGLLAIIAVISVATLTHQDFFTQYTGENFSPTVAFANGISSLITVMGFSAEAASNIICLAISAFILTTLDTTMRLGRFFWQEMTLPAYVTDGSEKPCCPKCQKIKTLLGNRFIATITLSFILFLFLTKFNLLVLWPIFGITNQLLASITLLLFSLWLFHNKKNFYIAIIPCVIMLCMSFSALCFQINSNWGKNNILVAFGIVFFVLITTIYGLGIKSFRRKKNK